MRHQLRWCVFPSRVNRKVVALACSLVLALASCLREVGEDT
ncbi:MAG: hypothetical protein RR218_02565 [Gordonibacter sp.]